MFKRLFGGTASGDRMAVDAIADYERSHDEFDVIRRLKEALALGLREVPLDRVYTFLGAAYGDVALHAEAEQAYETALRHNPQNSTALSNLGLLLERKNELQRCRELYQRAIEVKPNNGYAHNNLGALLLKQGLYREARAALERASAIDPTLTVAFANLARCCAGMGDFPSAQVAFQHASQSGYRQIESLQSELMERKLALPRVYFDEEAFFRLVGKVLPDAPELRALLTRAVREPQTVYAELTAAGRALFLTDFLVTHALPWLVLCEELQLRGLAVRGARRSLESWTELVLGAARARGLPVPSGTAQQLAAAARQAAAERRDEGNDDDALETFHDQLTADGEIVLLRMWEGPQQAIVCPLARSDWDQVAYPVFEGPEGPGMIDLIGHTQPEPVSGKILN